MKIVSLFVLVVLFLVFKFKKRFFLLKSFNFQSDYGEHFVGVVIKLNKNQNLIFSFAGIYNSIKLCGKTFKECNDWRAMT